MLASCGEPPATGEATQELRATVTKLGQATLTHPAVFPAILDCCGGVLVHSMDYRNEKSRLSRFGRRGGEVAHFDAPGLLGQQAPIPLADGTVVASGIAGPVYFFDAGLRVIAARPFPQDPRSQVQKAHFVSANVEAIRAGKVLTVQVSDRKNIDVGRIAVYESTGKLIWQVTIEVEELTAHGWAGYGVLAVLRDHGKDKTTTTRFRLYDLDGSTQWEMQHSDACETAYLSARRVGVQCQNGALFELDGDGQVVRSYQIPAERPASPIEGENVRWSGMQMYPVGPNILAHSGHEKYYVLGGARPIELKRSAVGWLVSPRLTGGGMLFDAGPEYILLDAYGTERTRLPADSSLQIAPNAGPPAIAYQKNSEILLFDEQGRVAHRLADFKRRATIAPVLLSSDLLVVEEVLANPVRLHFYALNRH
jgi:hypothetical protein